MPDEPRPRRRRVGVCRRLGSLLMVLVLLGCSWLDETDWRAREAQGVAREVIEDRYSVVEGFSVSNFYSARLRETSGSVGGLNQPRNARPLDVERPPGTCDRWLFDVAEPSAACVNRYEETLRVQTPSAECTATLHRWDDRNRDPQTFLFVLCRGEA